MGPGVGGLAYGHRHGRADEVRERAGGTAQTAGRASVRDPADPGRARAVADPAGRGGSARLRAPAAGHGRLRVRRLRPLPRRGRTSPVAAHGVVAELGRRVDAAARRRRPRAHRPQHGRARPVAARRAS